MNYSMTCPSPCNQVLRVDAKNDEEAVNKLMAAGKEHLKKSHPEMPPMPEANMMSMLKSNMKKE